MANEIQVKTDKYGDDYRVIDGQEEFALWVPITQAEKEKLMARAAAKGLHIHKMAADYIREALKEGAEELTLEDLAQVVGGLRATRPVASTVMCPW